MPTDVRTAVLIVGVVFVVAAVVISALMMFGKGAPMRAGRIPRAGLALVGAALIVWALVMPRPSTLGRATPADVPGAATSPAPAATATATAGAGAATSAPHPDLIVEAGAAFDSCSAPAAPGAPPDGATATRRQMLAGQASAKAFDAATAAYSGCLNSAGSNFSRQYGQLLNATGLRQVDALHSKINNSAVDTDQTFADKFNQQLRIFKARHGS